MRRPRTVLARRGVIFLLVGSGIGWAILASLPPQGHFASSQPGWRVPLQATFPASPPTPEPEAERLLAKAWERAADGLSPSPFQELWERWPDTRSAARARLYAVTTLPGFAPAETRPEMARQAAQHLVEAALDAPQLYFSIPEESSVVAVVAHFLASQVSAGRREDVWHICRELRWKAPRIGELAKVCRSVEPPRQWQEKLSTPNSAPGSLVPPGVRSVPLEQVDSELARRLEAYTLAPYEPERLARLVLALRSSGHRELSETLRSELLQLDVGRAAKLDAQIAQIEPPNYPGFSFDF